jgi:hypothetical protein
MGNDKDKLGPLTRTKAQSLGLIFRFLGPVPLSVRLELLAKARREAYRHRITVFVFYGFSGSLFALVLAKQGVIPSLVRPTAFLSLLFLLCFLLVIPVTTVLSLRSLCRSYLETASSSGTAADA